MAKPDNLIDTLPSEIILEILGFFNYLQLISIARVNKRFRELANNNLLWQALLVRDWEFNLKEMQSSINLNKPISNKEIYKLLSKFAKLASQYKQYEHITLPPEILMLACYSALLTDSNNNIVSSDFLYIHASRSAKIAEIILHSPFKNKLIERDLAFLNVLQTIPHYVKDLFQKLEEGMPDAEQRLSLIKQVLLKKAYYDYITHLNNPAAVNFWREIKSNEKFHIIQRFYDTSSSTKSTASSLINDMNWKEKDVINMLVELEIKSYLKRLEEQVDDDSSHKHRVIDINSEYTTLLNKEINNKNPISLKKPLIIFAIYIFAIYCLMHYVFNRKNFSTLNFNLGEMAADGLCTIIPLLAYSCFYFDTNCNNAQLRKLPSYARVMHATQKSYGTQDTAKEIPHTSSPGFSFLGVNHLVKPNPEPKGVILSTADTLSRRDESNESDEIRLTR